jgi:hypothetical protein
MCSSLDIGKLAMLRKFWGGGDGRVASMILNGMREVFLH